MKLYILNGPELDRLGEREPEIYGRTTFAELEQMCRQRASDLGWEVEFRQTDDESEMVAWLEEAARQADALVINPAIFTHGSQPVRDAMAQITVPRVEVHISNIYSREEWRRKSVVSEVMTGVIAGLGVRGYLLAIDAVAAMREET